MDTLDSGNISIGKALSANPVVAGLLHFATAPFRPRTYTNALFLALAFPLGLAYFVFLIVGMSIGLGLTIIWIGQPILALVFFGIWILAGFERQMAILLLGAQVPPRHRPEVPGVPVPVTRRIGDFFGNPATWKGIAYLFLKFPLGIVSFVSLITLSATSVAFIVAPFLWQWGNEDFYMEVPGFMIDSPLGAWALLPFGLFFLLVSLNLLNGLAWIWRTAATALLGSESFRSAAPALPSAPTPPAEPPSLDSALPA